MTGLERLEDHLEESVMTDKAIDDNLDNWYWRSDKNSSQTAAQTHIIRIDKANDDDFEDLDNWDWRSETKKRLRSEDYDENDNDKADNDYFDDLEAEAESEIEIVESDDEMIVPIRR